MVCITLLVTAIVHAVAAAGRPSVDIKNGTVVGTTSGGVDSFKGIPYAQPPVGALRLHRPLPLNSSFGTLNATSVLNICPQGPSDLAIGDIPISIITEITTNPVLVGLIGAGGASSTTDNSTSNSQGEDCLILNVQRPSGVAAGANLPVLLYIHGGGFVTGSVRQADGTSIVEQSIALNSGIVYVAIQYRLGAFGFLGGKALQNDNSTNLGMRDQRLALQWVQDNIAAFGGDPSQVTIWGESAGSLSVFNHLIIDGGNHTYKNGTLFRGAIMASGMAIPATDVASADPQSIYEHVANLSGCGNSSRTLSCLRKADYQVFLNASNSFPPLISYSSLNLPYTPRPDEKDTFFPQDFYTALERGQFARVPIISTSQEDEGTIFSLFSRNLTTTRSLVDFFQNWFPTAPREVVAAYVDSYPRNQSTGSPFRTGQGNNYTEEYKRFSAIVGDYAFTLSRRVALRLMEIYVPSIYSSLSSIFYGLPILGTFHGTDTLNIFTSAGPRFSKESLLTYMISFVHELQPNALNARTVSGNLTTWPRYNRTTGYDIVNFSESNVTVIKDDFRPAQFDALNTYRHVLLQ